MKILIKHFAVALLVLVLTLMAGIGLWRTALDQTIYSVSFCELIREPHRYDQKIVHVQAIYNQGAETSALSDPTCKGDGAWIRPECSSKSCDKIDESLKRVRRLLSSPADLDQVRVDVIGRYYAQAADDPINQPLRKVHVLEIIDVKAVSIGDFDERTSAYEPSNIALNPTANHVVFCLKQTLAAG